MPQIEEYVDEKGESPFGDWFGALDPSAAAIVTVALARLAEGNTSRVKGVGEGVAEVRIDRGPGFRIYFGWDGPALVVLLGGGSKRGQQGDIDGATRCWRDYKARKKAATKRERK